MQLMSEPAFAVESNVDGSGTAHAAPCMMHILLYFGIFYSSCLAQWIVLKRMTTEVNQHLPDSEQFPTSVWALFAEDSSRAD